jgi:hypothetical protein
VVLLEQLLPTATQVVDQLFAFVHDHHLLPLGEARPRVTEMPPYLWGFALATVAGPLESKPASCFYVDPVNEGWDRKTRDEHMRALNRAQLTMTAAHELLGHFEQEEAARRAPSTMERLPHTGLVGDGWAGYVDQALLDAGFAAPRAAGESAPASDPRLRLLQRREALLQLCRLVAALRLHAAGGKLDDAVDLLTDDGFLEENVARREAERVALDPLALDPGLGLLALEKLRDDDQRRRGDAFAVGDLHERMLTHGALPLGLLRKIVLGGDADGAAW